jgi:hypothetical protein
MLLSTSFTSTRAPSGLVRKRAFPLLTCLGGTGKDPVWFIREDELGAGLSYRPDPRNAQHDFVEPATAMTFEEYQ